jgi:hypothetical protein
MQHEKEVKHMNIRFRAIMIFLIFSFVALLTSLIACKPENDYNKWLPNKEKSIVRDILRLNNLKCTDSNWNQVANTTMWDGPTGRKFILRRIRIHSLILSLPHSVAGLNDLECIEITGSIAKPPMPAGLNYFKPVKCLLINDLTVYSYFNAVLSYFDPEHLSICKCIFKQFPDHLFNLSKLRFLCLNNDSLTELPGNFGKLQHLENLWVQGNFLKNMPVTITAIPKLSSIYIQDNAFDTFPSELVLLKNLRELNFSNNNIRRLPTSICSLTNITPGTIHYNASPRHLTRLSYNLRIYGNRICDPSPAICEYLDKFAGEGWQKYQLCK